MPKPPKKKKRPAHRPNKEIDWAKVDEFLISGCPGTKIAAALGVCADTLYLRCEAEKKMTFSAYSQQKRTIGDAILHKAQFDKAIGNTEKGDNTLLIFLGKARLEQRDTPAVAVSPEAEKNFAYVMDQLAEMQKNRQNTSQPLEKKEEI